MVVSMGPNQVELAEFNRWASPLGNNISRVVAVTSSRCSARPM
jgi:uncharacterized lipoprotein YmbA